MVLNTLLIYFTFETHLDSTKDIRKTVLRRTFFDVLRQNKNLVSWRVTQKLKVVWGVFVVAGDEDVHDLH